MDSWFAVEEIDNDTFAISEYRHWEETHCYLLLGTESAILIDTGLGISNIRNIVDHLTSLPVMVVTTHVHWDHIGGHKYFENIAVHEAEKDWLSVRFPIPLQVVKHNLICQPCDFPEDFILDDYQIFKGIPQQILHDGDCLTLGNRMITVIHTPGHSPGHCCFMSQNVNIYILVIWYIVVVLTLFIHPQIHSCFGSLCGNSIFGDKPDFTWTPSAIYSSRYNQQD